MALVPALPVLVSEVVVAVVVDLVGDTAMECVSLEMTRQSAALAAAPALVADLAAQTFYRTLQQFLT